MSDIERAWAAGFFDGEGSTCVKAGRSIVVSVTQAADGDACPETLLHFARAVQAGRLYGPYATRGKPIYRWTAVGAEAALAIGRLWPFLSRPKREQYQRVSDRIVGIRATAATGRMDYSAAAMVTR